MNRRVPGWYAIFVSQFLLSSFFITEGLPGIFYSKLIYLHPVGEKTQQIKKFDVLICGKSHENTCIALCSYQRSFPYRYASDLDKTKTASGGFGHYSKSSVLTANLSKIIACKHIDRRSLYYPRKKVKRPAWGPEPFVAQPYCPVLRTQKSPFFDLEKRAFGQVRI